MGSAADAIMRAIQNQTRQPANPGNTLTPQPTRGGMTPANPGPGYQRPRGQDNFLALLQAFLNNRSMNGS